MTQRHVLKAMPLLPVLGLLWSWSPALAEGCVQIGSSIFCGTEGAHNLVGRNAIFRTGRPGEAVGTTLFLDRPGKPSLGQTLPRLPLVDAPPDQPMPQAARPGDRVVLDPTPNFGAFEYPLTNRLGGTIAGSRAGPLGPSFKPLPR